MDIQFSDTCVLQARVLHMRSAHHVERIELNADDLCIVTLGERTALAQKGDLPSDRKLPAGAGLSVLEPPRRPPSGIRGECGETRLKRRKASLR